MTLIKNCVSLSLIGVLFTTSFLTNDWLDGTYTQSPTPQQYKPIYDVIKHSNMTSNDVTMDMVVMAINIRYSLRTLCVERWLVGLICLHSFFTFTLPCLIVVGGNRIKSKIFQTPLPLLIGPLTFRHGRAVFILILHSHCRSNRRNNKNTEPKLTGSYKNPPKKSVFFHSQII